ncbi:MAG: hypothetical protein OEY51_14670 [Cyclobacteriaceae bacterium]|nr:hypothetical protein [Cyclobacteriaceae bacterium]
MIKTFTRNDIVRFLYGEMTESEIADFRMSLSSDYDLKERLKDHMTLLEEMDKSMIDPPDRVINNILNYSKNYKLKSIGT